MPVDVHTRDTEKQEEDYKRGEDWEATLHGIKRKRMRPGPSTVGLEENAERRTPNVERRMAEYGKPLVGKLLRIIG